MATTGTPRRVDVQAFIDAAPVSPLQKRLLFLCFVVIAIDGFDTAIIGYISRGLMTLAVFAAGACISGGQVGGNALSAAFYPTPYRATGVAWANGIGRAGSIVGSLLGGLLLGFGWPATTVYALVAVPAVISAVALGTLGWMRASSA